MVSPRVLSLTSYYQLAALGVVVGLCWLMWREAAPSVVAGGLVMTGNFVLLRYLAGKVMGPGKAKMGYVVLLGTKMLLALVVIAGLMHVFKLQAAGFALGLATLFVGMGLSSLHLSLTDR